MRAAGQVQEQGQNGRRSQLSARYRRAVLAVMCLSLMMVVAAVASLNVALPDLSRSTGATQTQLQWIVDAYALVLAGLLLPAGALGDRYGRKGILLTGLLIFGGASAGAIFAHQPSASGPASPAAGPCWACCCQGRCCAGSPGHRSSAST
jgi:MFS family permease